MKNLHFSERKIKLLILLAALSAGVILISNLAAVKLWDLFGIAADGGLVIFPLSYILGDLIVELYGGKISKTTIITSFILNIIAAIVFWIVIALPPFPGWEMQDQFASVLGFAPRIIFGSLIAYVVSSILNVKVFERIKAKTGEKKYLLRALGSSAVARIFDIVIFELIAFLGVLPFEDFIKQAIFAYILGFAFETILSPLEMVIVNKIKKFVKD